MNLFLKKAGIFSVVAFSMLLFNCATTYKRPDLSQFRYSNEQIVNDSLKVSYADNYQLISSNYRYSKKEIKKGFNTVAVKIQNISDHYITLNREKFKIFAGERERAPVAIEIYTKNVKQKVGFHLLHALWGPWSYSYQENLSTGESDSRFIYIPAGAIVGIANAAVAGTANKRQKETFQKYNIWRQRLKPGETIHGIIILQEVGIQKLTFTFEEEQQ